MKLSSKRAEYVALTGLGLNIVFFVATFVLSRWSGSGAIFAISWQILAGALIWLVLLVQFHQRALAEREKLDNAQLAEAKTDGTIFQVPQEQQAPAAQSSSS